MTDVKCDKKDCLSNSGGECNSPWIDLKGLACVDYNPDSVDKKEKVISEVIDKLLMLKKIFKDDKTIQNEIEKLCYELDDCVNGIKCD